MLHETWVAHAKLCATAALNRVFLTLGHSQKSLKAADLGKMQFCAQQAPGKASLVPERLGAAFYGKKPASFILMFTNFVLKVLVTYLVGRKAIGDRSTNFSPSYKLENGHFNSAQ